MASKGKLVPPRVVRDETFAPELRAQIRAALAVAARRGHQLHVALLQSAVGALGFRCTLEELREELLWNQSKGFVDYEHNTDFARDEWFLTPRGKAKEGVQ